MIPIYEPYLNKKILKYAHDAIDSTWISSRGPFIDKAEEKLKELLDVKYIKLVNNGTSATHLCVKALLRKNSNIKNLIVPNNVYVAAWNTALYENMRLIPIDADLQTWNADFQSINSDDFDPNDTAISLVHNIGNIIDIAKVKKKFPNFIIIEDNCEGFMGKYGKDYSGTQSFCSSISFFGNKTITSGEGGAVVVSEEEAYNYINCIQGQGQSPTIRYIHDEIGYNYRMTNIQAAILYGQLEHLNEILDKKKFIFETYKNNLSNNNIFFQEQEPDTSHSRWMFGIRTNKNYKLISQFLHSKGIDSRQMFFPMSSHRHLTKVANKNLEKNAKTLNETCIILPSYPNLKKKEILYICENINKFLG